MTVSSSVTPVIKSSRKFYRLRLSLLAVCLTALTRLILFYMYRPPFLF